MKPCSDIICNRPAKVRGMCQKHYQRAYLAGTISVNHGRLPPEPPIRSLDSGAWISKPPDPSGQQSLRARLSGWLVSQNSTAYDFCQKAGINRPESVYEFVAGRASLSPKVATQVADGLDRLSDPPAP